MERHSLLQCERDAATLDDFDIHGTDVFAFVIVVVGAAFGTTAVALLLFSVVSACVALTGADAGGSPCGFCRVITSSLASKK